MQNEQSGRVYFIRDGAAIKIGFSDQVKRRLRGLQTGHHATLELLGSVSAGALDDLSIHARFAHLRIRGEWFRAEPELMAFIEELRESGAYVAMTPKEQIKEVCQGLVCLKRKHDSPAVSVRCDLLRTRLQWLAANPDSPPNRALVMQSVRELEQMKRDGWRYIHAHHSHAA